MEGKEALGYIIQRLLPLYPWDSTIFLPGCTAYGSWSKEGEMRVVTLKHKLEDGETSSQHFHCRMKFSL